MVVAEDTNDASWRILPMQIINYVRGKRSFYSRGKASTIIKSLTGEDPQTYYAELEASQFHREMRSLNDYLIKNKLGNVPIDTEAKFLYALCRAFKPEKVVETGPGTGISSFQDCPGSR